MSLFDNAIQTLDHEAFEERYHEILSTYSDPDNPIRRQIAAMTTFLEMTAG